MRFAAPYLLLSLSVAMTPAVAGAETLYDALAAAYSNNPDLQNARAALRVTDEGVPQALSGWRLTLSVFGDGGKERREAGSIDQDLTPLSIELQVTQPLYRGGRTVASTEQAESQVEASRAILLATEQDVLFAAVTAYMDVVRDRANVQLTTNNEQVIRRQLEATKDRFEVGEVTRTDVAQAEARLARASANRISAEGSLAISVATYERVVGETPQNPEPAPPLPPLPANLADSIDTSVQNNPTLQSARFNEEAAKHGVRVAFGSLLPTVNLVGSVERSDEIAFEDIDNESESIAVLGTVPLYQSGAVYSQVREAKEVRNQRRIQIEQARRATVEEATQSWESLTTARSNIAARREEVRANEIALEGVQQEAAVGARTVLDILDAEQELLDARVALIFAERDEYVAGFRLLSAVGGLSADGIGVAVELYDPTRHYGQVRNKWFGLTPPE